MGSIVVVVVLAVLESVVEEADIVDHLTLEEAATFPFSRGVAGSMRMPLSMRCQWDA